MPGSGGGAAPPYEPRAPPPYEVRPLRSMPLLLLLLCDEVRPGAAESWVLWARCGGDPMDANERLINCDGEVGGPNPKDDLPCSPDCVGPQCRRERDRQTERQRDRDRETEKSARREERVARRGDERTGGVV